jgi:hypothetical protein
MRKLLISTMLIVPWLAGTSLAATDGAATKSLTAGGNGGICRPSDTDWDPCGTGWSQSPIQPEVRHEHGHQHDHEHDRHG